MIEIALIFAALIVALLCVSFPFLLILQQQHIEKKELEAQRIIDRLRGLEGPRVDWNIGL